LLLTGEKEQTLACFCNALHDAGQPKLDLICPPGSMENLLEMNLYCRKYVCLCEWEKGELEIMYVTFN